MTSTSELMVCPEQFIHYHWSNLEYTILSLKTVKIYVFAKKHFLQIFHQLEQIFFFHFFQLEIEVIYTSCVCVCVCVCVCTRTHICIMTWIWHRYYKDKVTYEDITPCPQISKGFFFEKVKIHKVHV